MDYKLQIDEITKYIKSGEKDVKDFKIGVEFEHFVINKDTLETISYYGKDGVAETLKDLEKQDWKGMYEEGYILGLTKGDLTITLEPGSQLEVSVESKRDIRDLEKNYLSFLSEIIPILESKNQGLMAVGYHPQTKIEDIKILPKKRYDIMFDYFKDKGVMAHNMMKGSAAFQVSMDFESEEDYLKKFKITNALSPVIYSLFENAYYFEGEVYNHHNLRAHIWENCDKDRSGIATGALEKDFSYEDYAKYILNGPPIFIYQDGEAVATHEKLVRELFDPKDYERKELEHLLTMFFPDVRTKSYIEIRMMDSVPYPLNFAIVALWKGLLYNEESLNKVWEYIQGITIEDVNQAKVDMEEVGLKTILKDKTFLEIGMWLVEVAKEGLSEEEKKYILPLEGMLGEGKTPYDLTKEREKYGKIRALNWCLLNNPEEVI